MEAVSAARLRRAEQRIAALRPYADAVRHMTRRAAWDAGGDIARVPLLETREEERHVGILIVTADRGLAGAFNSQIVRAAVQLGSELDRDGHEPVWYASGRRGISSLMFRGRELAGSYSGFTDRPGYADARQIATELTGAFLERKLDRVEIIYNAYVSPLTQRVTRETLLPASAAAVAGEELGEDENGRRTAAEYEPEADKLLHELVPHYIGVTIYRALLESAASEHGARMTAMRSATDNAGELIQDLALEMNRARQAEITREILEVVAGAESLV